MKTITIAFDVDGTLIRDGYMGDSAPRANERVRSLLHILAHMKNVKIIVWSGGGELYARQIAREIGVAKYVDEYASKNYVKHEDCPDGDDCKHHIFKPEIKPDIAIDDIQDCELGVFNLIVREK